MNHSNIVQHVSPKKYVRDKDTGFDRVFKLEYMGKSEFEFGAANQSLKRIRFEKEKYAKHNIGPFVAVCKENQISDVEAYVIQAFDDEYKLAPGWPAPKMKAVYEGKHYHDLVMWWSFDQDWFVCLNESIAEKLMGVLRENPKQV